MKISRNKADATSDEDDCSGGEGKRGAIKQISKLVCHKLGF